MIAFRKCSKDFIFRTKSVFYTKSVWYEARFGTKTVELSIIFSLELEAHSVPQFRQTSSKTELLRFSEMDLRKFSSLPSIDVVDDESSSADSAVLDDIKVTNCKGSRISCPYSLI